MMGLACSQRVTPCRSAEACGPATECLANRCTRLGADPVAPGSDRIVLAPTRWAVSGDAPNDGQEVRLGGPGDSSQTLYLDFELTQARGRSIDSAFLLLYPTEWSEPLGAPLLIRVERVATEWNARALARGGSPRAATGLAEGIASARQLVRVDVTELLRHQLIAPAGFQGLMIRGDGSGPQAFVASPGISGRAPQLELYLAAQATR